MITVTNTVDRVILGLVSGFILAMVGGTIVWILWPYVIPVIIPKLVTEGWVIPRIGWWTSVLFNWLMGCLMRSWA